jgi:hypothetical protein
LTKDAKPFTPSVPQKKKPTLTLNSKPFSLSEKAPATLPTKAPKKPEEDKPALPKSHSIADIIKSTKKMGNLQGWSDQMKLLQSQHPGLKQIINPDTPNIVLEIM